MVVEGGFVCCTWLWMGLVGVGIEGVEDMNLRRRHRKRVAGK